MKTKYCYITQELINPYFKAEHWLSGYLKVSTHFPGTDPCLVPISNEHFHAKVPGNVQK